MLLSCRQTGRSKLHSGNKFAKVIWEEGRVAALSQIYAVKFLLVTMARPKFTPKGPLVLDRSPNPCLIPGPVRPMMPKDIWIRSAVFPQCTGQTDTQTNRSSTESLITRPLRYESDAA